MMEKRLGKFYIHRDVLETEELFSILKELQFIPYHVEFLYHQEEFEYIGHSPLFKVIKIGEIIPIYKIIIHKLTKDGSLTVEVEIVK